MTYKNINKKGIRITLLLISLCQLGSLAISSVISDITKAFPIVSELLNEAGIGNASTAGLLSGLFLFGGILYSLTKLTAV